MTTRPAARYAGCRYPAEIIATAVWLYLRFPLSLRMVEEVLARDHRSATDYRGARTQTFQVWAEVAGAPLAA